MRDGGQEQLVEVAKDVRERLRGLGRRGGQPGAQLARLDLGEHRELAQALEVRRDPLDRRRPVFAKAHLRSFSICFQVRVFKICACVSQARRACATPSST